MTFIERLRILCNLAALQLHSRTILSSSNITWTLLLIRSFLHVYFDILQEHFGIDFLCKNISSSKALKTHVASTYKVNCKNEREDSKAPERISSRPLRMFIARILYSCSNPRQHQKNSSLSGEAKQRIL